MLTPRKRITKKTLKEDKFITYSLKARVWIEEHANLMLGAAAAIIVVLVAVFFISNARKKAEAAVSLEFANAMSVFESRDYKNAVSMFTNIVNNYGGTTSGKLGRFYLAQSLYKTNEYAAAEENFRKFAGSFRADDYLKATALAGEAACLEQQDQFAKAAPQYESIVKKFAKSPNNAHYLLRAARCYALAGNAEKADGLYQKIIKDYPDSPEKSDAILYGSLE